MDSTNGQARSGMAVKTGAHTPIVVKPASLEVLIGGPYTDGNGEEHSYGHAALGVITEDSERVYDFGRYAGETGATGQGRLRVWTSLRRYIIGENKYGRRTTGFLYTITQEQAERVNSHYSSLFSGRPVVGNATREYVAEYRLLKDYHALTNNCVTSTMAGVRLVLPVLEKNAAAYNNGRGMSFTERTAARVAGWPTSLFMPADLQAALEANTERRADKVEQFGPRK